MMRPEAAAAWATGAGIGVLAFMIAWLLLNRLLALWLPVPVAPIVAMSSAVVVGIGVFVERGRALARRAVD